LCLPIFITHASLTGQLLVFAELRVNSCLNVRRKAVARNLDKWGTCQGKQQSVVVVDALAACRDKKKWHASTVSIYQARSMLPGNPRHEAVPFNPWHAVCPKILALWC
jgi:hypothetical protein